MPFCSRPSVRALLFAPFCSRPSVRALLFALISCLLLCAFCSADPIVWDANAQGQFITSLCQDTHACTWIGTEDLGVWRYDPNAPKGQEYARFSTVNGLADDSAYALACDKAGRVWVGTLNHGVSVFNGKDWRTYGPVDGPLGSRVFALAVSPVDGGVWGATEVGLFRYVNSHWTYFTRADGLPSDQANALAFDQDGTLYVGTQCDGIAIASPADGYHSWRVVAGPASLPNAPSGTGLPSALINCLLVTKSGAVYAGTDGGLAASVDKGKTWTYRRGLDWKAKELGLLPAVTPAALTVAGNLLSEDYVTCLAEGADGSVFVGHRQTGVEAFSVKTGLRMQSGLNGAKPDSYVTALLVTGQAAWAGLYGGGVLPPNAAPIETAALPSAPVPPLPVPAAPPTLAQLNAMLRVVSAVAPNKNELTPKVVALDDDWVTEGDWLGRYGRYWACLNATCAPQNYVWGAGWETVNYDSQIGPNAAAGDSLRYWVHWLYTQNPRVLELPPTYLDSRVKKGLTTPDNNRREAEIDDHGEDYPQTKDGPSIYQIVTVPSGLFTLSLYDFNKDGHDWYNRWRDYRISIRAHASSALDDISDFDAEPELAHGRIRDFWGGVYKRFLVRGPVALTIKLDRNNSKNTILPAVMLDLVDETPPPYFKTVDQWEQVQAHQQKQRQQAASQGRIASFQTAATEREAADRVLEMLSEAQVANSSWSGVHGGQFYEPLLRWYTQAAAHSTKAEQTNLNQHLATCCYQMGQYQTWEEVQKRNGLTPARDIEKALRWDGVSEGGQDYEVVNKYLSTARLTSGTVGDVAVTRPKYRF